MGGVGPWARGRGCPQMAGERGEVGKDFPSKSQKEGTADSSWFVGFAAGM